MGEIGTYLKQLAAPSTASNGRSNGHGLNKLAQQAASAPSVLTGGAKRVILHKEPADVDVAQFSRNNEVFFSNEIKNLRAVVHSE